MTGRDLALLAQAALVASRLRGVDDETAEATVRATQLSQAAGERDHLVLGPELTIADRRALVRTRDVLRGIAADGDWEDDEGVPVSDDVARVLALLNAARRGTEAETRTEADAQT